MLLWIASFIFFFRGSRFVHILFTLTLICWISSRENAWKYSIVAISSRIWATHSPGFFSSAFNVSPLFTIACVKLANKCRSIFTLTSDKTRTLFPTFTLFQLFFRSCHVLYFFAWQRKGKNYVIKRCPTSQFSYERWFSCLTHRTEINIHSQGICE